MKNLFKTLPICFAAFALSALNARADGTNLTAAQAWTALTNFSLTPPPMAWATNPPTQDDLAKFDDQRAAEAAVLAERARDFYTRFSGSTNVARARVTEIQALQMAIRYGATNRLGDLLAREEVLAADTNAPEGLRYQLRLDQLGRTMQAAVAAGADANTELEKTGRTLVKEFPGGSQGYEILLQLAEQVDLAKMREFADLMAGSGGPPEFAELGKGLQRRLDAVGKPLTFAFTAMDGRTVNLTTLSNKVVLVDFWGTWCPVCVQEMPELKKLYRQYQTNGFEIVGIDCDDDTNQVQRFLQAQGVTWPQYFGGKTDNKYAKEYAISFFPAVWLLDRKGILRDIHGRMNLEAKIEKLLAE